MTGPLLNPGRGDHCGVTTVAPFGVLVTAGGVPGLVRGTSAVVGDQLCVRVVEYDDVEQRSGATAA